MPLCLARRRRGRLPQRGDHEHARVWLLPAREPGIRRVRTRARGQRARGVQLLANGGGRGWNRYGDGERAAAVAALDARLRATAAPPPSPSPPSPPLPNALPLGDGRGWQGVSGVGRVAIELVRRLGRGVRRGTGRQGRHLALAASSRLEERRERDLLPASPRRHW